METEEESVPINRLVAVYIKIRTKIQALEKEHEQMIEGLKGQRDEVANAMKDMMREAGVKSMRTDMGTVILGESRRYFTNDWEAMKEFILENHAVDLLEKRIAQTNMAQFLEQYPDKLPPGLNVQSEVSVSVRKPTK